MSSILNLPLSSFVEMPSGEIFEWPEAHVFNWSLTGDALPSCFSCHSVKKRKKNPFHVLFSTMFYSISQTIREVQTQTTSVRMPGWKCKMVQLLRKPILSFQIFVLFLVTSLFKIGPSKAWRAAIHGVAKSRTWLSDWTELNRAVPLPYPRARRQWCVSWTKYMC